MKIYHTSIRKTSIVVSLLLTTLIFQSSFGQEFSKHSLSYSCGVGLSDGSGWVGGGLALSFGYKLDIWKDKLRFNPNLLVGAYKAENITDVRDQYFNSVNLRLLFDYDLLRYKSVSLNINAGGIINTTRGLMGTGGEFPHPESKYVNNWYFGGVVSGGIRIKPPNKRYAINIIPINLNFGNDYFLEALVMIGIDIKLK